MKSPHVVRKRSSITERQNARTPHKLTFMFMLETMHLHYSADQHLLFMVVCFLYPAFFLLLAAQKAAVRRGIPWQQGQSVF